MTCIACRVQAPATHATAAVRAGLLWLGAALLSLALVACGGGGGGASTSTDTSTGTGSGTGTLAPVPASCALADQQSWLLAYMRDQYFWYDRLGTPNAAAANIDTYFRSLLYASVDRYSYTQPTADFNEFFSEGTRTGYGYSVVFTDASFSTLRVRLVEPGSPVAEAGLRRGDTIVSIDGYTPLQIAAGAAGRVTAEGIVRNFVVRGTDGVQRSFSATSRTFALQPVLADQVLPVSAATAGLGRVGYLTYQEFIAAGRPGLQRAFSQFATQGVNELVLDLRYNGGGSVDESRDLASMIGGSRLDGRVFAELRFNARHPEYNEFFRFTANAASLPGPMLSGLSRVFILTSANTASASELLANALKPFMDVVLIGGTTYGKPYGFSPVEACGTVFSAVNFDTVNALGEGGYYNGLAARCNVADDLDHALGDPQEAALGAALYYARNGVCPGSTGSAGTGAPTPQGFRLASPIGPLGESSPMGMWRR